MLGGMSPGEGGATRRQRQGQLYDIISRPAKPTQDLGPRSELDTKVHCPGKGRRGADHLRIPDLIQICHVCKGRGLPSTGMRWCQKWDVHRHGDIGAAGAGYVSRGVAGAREFQGLATATMYSPAHSRDI